jgi:hypothetical protein
LKSGFKKYGKIHLLLGFLVLVLYAFQASLYFPSIESPDTLENAYLVEKALYDPVQSTAFYLYSPAHLLQNPLYYGVGKILAIAGFHGSLLVPLKCISVLFNFLALLVACVLMSRLLGKTIPAFIGTVLFGASYGFLFWGGQIKAYPITLFFCLLALWAASYPGSRWATAGAAASSAAAAGFSLSALPLFAVIPLFMLSEGGFTSRAWKRAGRYLALSAALALLLFLWMSSLLLDLPLFSPGNVNSIAGTTLSTLSLETPGIFTPGSMSGDFSPSSRLSSLFSNLLSSVVRTGDETSGEKLKWAKILLALNAVLLVIPLACGILRPGKNMRPVLLLSAVWLLIFGASFFLGDPENGFVYVMLFGASLLAATSSAESGTGKTALVTLILLLALINTCHFSSLHRPDERADDWRKIGDTARTYDVFVAGIIPHFYGRNPYLNYCLRTTFITMSPDDLKALKTGLFAPRLGAEIYFWLRSGRRVFLSRSCVELAIEDEETRASFWRALRSGFKVSDSFTTPAHDLAESESFVRIEKK